MDEALDGIQAEAIERTMRVARAAADAGGRMMLSKINTSGAGMPYKHEPNTARRYKTGRMLASVGSEGWTPLPGHAPHKGRFRAVVGFGEDRADYFLYQDKGTRYIKGMLAVAAAKVIVEDTLREGLK